MLSFTKRSQSCAPPGSERPAAAAVPGSGQPLLAAPCRGAAVDMEARARNGAASCPLEGGRAALRDARAGESRRPAGSCDGAPQRSARRSLVQRSAPVGPAQARGVPAVWRRQRASSSCRRSTDVDRRRRTVVRARPAPGNSRCGPVRGHAAGADGGRQRAGARRWLLPKWSEMRAPRPPGRCAVLKGRVAQGALCQTWRRELAADVDDEDVAGLGGGIPRKHAMHVAKAIASTPIKYPTAPM